MAAIAVFEMQMHAGQFLLAMGLGFIRRPIRSREFTYAGEAYVLDRVDFGPADLRSIPDEDRWIRVPDPRRFTSVPHKRLEILQQATVVLIKKADLGRSNPARVEWKATLHFGADVFLSSRDSSDAMATFFSLSLASFESHLGGAEADSVRNQMGPFWRATFPVQTFAVPLAESALPGAQLLNAGIAANTALSQITIRVEIGAPRFSSENDWRSFFAGNAPDRLHGRLWGVFVSQDVMVNIVANQIYQGASTQDRLRLRSSIGGTWSSPGGHPHIDAHFNGDAITREEILGEMVRLCPCDINLDVSLSIDLSVDNNQIVTDTHVDWDGNALDELCCETTAALTLGLAYGAFTTIISGGNILAGAIGAVLGFVVGFFEAVMFTTNLGGLEWFDPTRVRSANCGAVSNDHMRCTFPVPTLRLGANAVSVNEIAGDSDGALFSGSITLTPQRQARLRVRVVDFEWLPPFVPCSAADASTFARLRQNPLLAVSCSAKVELDNDGDAPLVITQISLLENPNQLFQLSRSGMTVGIKVALDKVQRLGLSRVPECRVLIASNGGLETAVIPATDVISNERALQLIATAEVLTLPCSGKIRDWRGGSLAQYASRWLLDPDPDPRSRQLWLVTARGLVSGQSLSLISSDQSELTTATADESGFAQLSVLTSRAQEVVVSRDDAAIGNDLERRERGLEIRQVLFRPSGSLESRSEIRMLTGGYFLGHATLGLLTSSELRLYRVEDPYTLTVGASLHVAEARGVLEWGRTLVTWGGGGLAVLRQGAGEAFSIVSDTPIQAVTALGTRLYALSGEALHVYDDKLQPQGSFPICNGAHVAGSGSTIAVSDGNRVLFLDVAHGRAPVEIGAHTCHRIEGLQPVARRDAFLIAEPSGRSELVDTATRRAPRVLTRSKTTPWLVGSVRCGNAVFRLSRSRRAVRQYDVSVSADG
jgi:hypothetical protein